MKRLINQLKSYVAQLISVIRNEYRTIFTDEGVILILVLAIIIYATVYSYAYDTQVLRDVPICIVDDNKSASSRELVTNINAGPNSVVAYDAPDMESAKRLFFDREVYGIVYIPKNYEKQLLGGKQAVVSIYIDASYFLVYGQVLQEFVAGIRAVGGGVTFETLVANGASIAQAAATTQPIIYQSKNLFNPYLGYGTFVMPAIIILLIQQTLLIGIGMIGGTWREFGLYQKLTPLKRKRMSTLPIVMGKAWVYFSIYAITTLYLLKLHYQIFEYPINGEWSTIVLLITPYLLSSIFMGITVSTFFKKRETSMLLLLWTSIPFLMLTGVSYPREAIPEWLNIFADILPSTHGVDAFIRIQSMGASFSEVLGEIKMLWILTIVYGGLSVIAMHCLLRKIGKKR